MSNPAFANGTPYANNVATTLSITNSGFAMVAGDVVIVPLATYCDTVVPGIGSVADNKGNTFTWLAGMANSTTDRCRVDLFVSPPLAAGYATGTYTVTATANASNGANNEQGFNFQRWTGFGVAGAALDVSGTATLAPTTASGTVTLSAGTAKQPVEAVIAIVHFNDDTNPDGIGTPTGTGTWVLDFANTDASTGLATGAAHQVTSATGTTYSATWSGLNTTTNFGGSMLIAALYPAIAAVNATAYTVQCAPGLSVSAPGRPVGGIPPNMSLRAASAAGLLAVNEVLSDGRTVMEALASGTVSIPAGGTTLPYRG